MSDLLRKYKSLYSSTTNTFSTGESVTITPASVVGLPTDTEITLTFDRVDSSGTKTPSKMERIRGTVVGSNFVVSSGGRAVEGTEQTHTSPVVEMVWNADDWNDMVDWGLVEHGQDGKHSSALVTTLKATGAVVNTGTSDDTIVTPKALADSDYAKTSDITVTADSTTTFTNKTLTYPKINEDVELTATATQLNALVGAGSVDGWTAVTDTWAYASATTITVPSGAAALYKVGDKIKLTQTTVKYFYIVGVADTVLTVTGGSDYTVENDVITSPYYSHQENPIGFPQYFNSSITFDVATLDNGTGGQPTINCARFSISGNTCLGYMSISGTKAATTKTMIITSSGLPTPNSTLGNANSGSANYDNGSNYVPIGFIYRSSGVFWFVSASDITDNSTVANLSSQFKYQI